MNEGFMYEEKSMYGNWFQWLMEAGPPMLVCRICGKKFPEYEDYPVIVSPNQFCNIAIELPCGHFMLDDCANHEGQDIGLNGACVKHHWSSVLASHTVRGKLFYEEHDYPHIKDEDCIVNYNNICIVCGVFHGDPCPDCGGRGFHKEDCPSF